MRSGIQGAATKGCGFWIGGAGNWLLAIRRRSLTYGMAAFRSLKVWQHAQRFAVECGKATKRFPITDRGILADQLRRAAFSVPLNISEGSARKGAKEFRRFLDTARGSLAEAQNALELAVEMEYLTRDEYDRLDAIATETAKTLWGLLRKIGDIAHRFPSS